MTIYRFGGFRFGAPWAEILALEFRVEIVVVMAWWDGGVGGHSNSEESQEVGTFGCVIFFQI